MWQRLYARVRALGDFKADSILAGAFAVAGLLESALDNSGNHSRLLTGVLAVAISATVAWRRRATPAAVLAVMVIAAIAAPLNTFAFVNLDTPFVIVLLLAYSIGRHETGPRAWLELVPLVVAVVVTGGIRSPGDVLWTVVFIGCPALAGRVLRNRSLFQGEMREKAQRLEAERHLRSQRAVEDERARIASELQAVVANGVSAMVVQAEAVPRLFETGKHEAASQALAVIEDTGRDALTEMRRLLGVLRREGDGVSLAPQPTLARVDALLDRMQAQGLEAELTVEGQQVDLPPGVDLAGFRVLQEALASAIQSGGISHAAVSIVYGDENVLVKVRDKREGSGGPDTEILRALRERVSLYGGVLRASAQGNGFEIEARLPIGGPR